MILTKSHSTSLDDSSLLRLGLFSGFVDAREEVFVAVAGDHVELGLVGVALARPLQLTEEILRVMPVLGVRLPDLEQVLVVYKRIQRLGVSS